MTETIAPTTSCPCDLLTILLRTSYTFSTMLMGYLTATEVAMVMAACKLVITDHIRIKFLNPIRDVHLSHEQEVAFTRGTHTFTLLGNDCHRILHRIQYPIQYCSRYGRMAQLSFLLVIRPHLRPDEGHDAATELIRSIPAATSWNRPASGSCISTSVWVCRLSVGNLVDVREVVDAASGNGQDLSMIIYKRGTSTLSRIRPYGKNTVTFMMLDETPILIRESPFVNGHSGDPIHNLVVWVKKHQNQSDGWVSIPYPIP